MMQSNAYINKNNPHYEQINADVAKHMQRLYPGQMEMDATGRLHAPEYDMTKAQFDAAQAEIESDFEEAKAEAEEELNEGLPDDQHIDIDQFMVAGDPIGVKVLYPNGDIRTENLETFDLDIPEGVEPQKKPEYVYVWTTGGENPCDVCEMMDGTILDDDHVPKPHPNCNCFATKMPKTDFEKKYGGADAKKQEKLKELYAKEKEWQMKAEEKHNPKDMGLSRSGMIFLKDKENKVLDKDGRHVIYDDKTQKPVPAGQPLPDGATIGYGHLVQKGEDFSKGLSEKEATELFKQDIRNAENIVKNNISAPINQHQFDGLVSLAYNIGAGNFAGSTIRQYVNNPNHKDDDYPTPESAWKAWNKDRNPKTGKLEVVKGLVNRRNDDWNIYENGIY